MISVERSLQHYFSLKVENEKLILKMSKEHVAVGGQRSLQA